MLDATIRVEQVTRDPSGLEISFGNKGDLELLLDFKPDDVLFKGTRIDCEARKGTGTWIVDAKLPSAGPMRVLGGA